MSDLEFRPTSTHFRLGATTLPGEYYTSPAVFAAERQRIGLRSWHCVGRSARILQPGDFFLQDLAGESVIVLRIKDGSIRAHFNLCRHRGTRLCDRESGRFSETIQCPYHAWTYGLDGRLVGAPHMNEVPDFRKQDYPLHSARVAEWEGFLFLNLDPDPIPFDRAFGPLLSRLERFSPARLVSARRRTYQVRANWKLVFQNYSECLHCPMIHPELTAKVPYQSGANDLVEGPLLGGFMEIVPGHQSVTLSGRPAGLAISAAAEDRMRGYYYTAIPNWMISIHPDYLNYYTIWPLGPDRTRIESEWLFHPDAPADPGFNPDDAVEIWEATNRQDWDIIERAQSGIASVRYRPGPYSARESLPAAWDRAYLELMAGGEMGRRGDGEAESGTDGGR